MSSNLFFDMNPLDAYFINQSLNPGKLTFVNASFWGKRARRYTHATSYFHFDLYTYPPHTILRDVSRVSSLILRAKPWLAKKRLRHGNRFAVEVDVDRITILSPLPIFFPYPQFFPEHKWQLFEISARLKLVLVPFSSLVSYIGHLEKSFPESIM